MQINEVKATIEKELFSLDFADDKLNNTYLTTDNIYVKKGNYSFQTAIFVFGFDNQCFRATISFDICTTGGILKYLRPYSINKKNGLYRLDITSNVLSFEISSSKQLMLYHLHLLSKAKCWGYESLDAFIEYLQTDVMEIIEKYINPINHLEYLIELDKNSDTHPLLFVIAVIYEQLGNINEAIDYLEKYIEWRLSYRGIDKNDLIQHRAYIDYLKNGTPLPYIPFPNDIVSVFSTKGEDIYIAINKKAIKDSELLEYFSPQDSFTKAKKISFNDTIDDEGIIISKLGKWCILRLSFDMINEFSQDKLEILLKTLSEKYTQTILFINQDVTATFGFEVYKKGELLRKWMAGDGEVLENIGKPLKNEKKQFLDTITEDIDEQSVISFLDTIIKVSHNDLDNSKSVYYAIKVE
jgi:tetratricopeptide (TPR) repeat protein